MDRHVRTKALGNWGEQKALELLNRQGSGFANARDVNAQTNNHPFGDIYAERGGERFLIGVKTRNRYRDIGKLNSEYNVEKKGHDVAAVARPYKAALAWIAIQVIPELQTFNAYFGTLLEIKEHKERFSIPMKSEQTARYFRLGDEDEFDPTLRREWTNGGYPFYLELGPKR